MNFSIAMDADYSFKVLAFFKHNNSSVATGVQVKSTQRLEKLIINVQPSMHNSVDDILTARSSKNPCHEISAVNATFEFAIYRGD